MLEGAFTDHFNSAEETFDEFIHRLREDPGHRWDHWWLAELLDDPEAPEPVGALVGTVSESDEGPDGSYVSYLGVLESARGRGVAKGLLRTIIADAAARGRDRVGLEVDADSPTGADGLYVAMGWGTRYVTESWHKDVPGHADAVARPGRSQGLAPRSAQRLAQRAVHPGGREHADEGRAPLDADHRLVVAQQRGERLLERGVEVDGRAELAALHAVERLEVLHAQRGDREAAQAARRADEVGHEVVGRVGEQLHRGGELGQPAARSAKTATRSPIRTASSMSWVTSTTVLPSSRCSRRNSSWSRVRTTGSTAPKGSSISSTGGLAARARATPTRWRWPPESWCG